MILCSADVAGRQSATAAAETKTVAPGTSRSRLFCMFSADFTFTRPTPRGVGSPTGPATSVTWAPASWAARAMANPILPLERLVRPRTGSMASKVGPALTSTCWPASGLGWKKRVRS